MIRFEQTHDALNHIQSFHTALSQYYLALSKRASDERIRMALHYLSEHEQKSAQEIVNYQSQARPAILNTWFQYTNDDEILKIPQPNAEDNLLTMDEIGSVASKFGQELITLYEDLYAQSDTEELQELFVSLKQAQIQMNKQLSVAIDRMMDV